MEAAVLGLELGEQTQPPALDVDAGVGAEEVVEVLEGDAGDLAVEVEGGQIGVGIDRGAHLHAARVHRRRA